MTAEIKVSFILPVYNMSAYLSQCLDSLCGQSLREIQIICVDDGSTDDSMSILQGYAEKDGRVEIVRNKVKGPGAAHARNTGIKEARGEYILFLDSDDYFHLSLAEKTYQKAVETKADVVLFDAVKFDTSSGALIPTNQFLNYGLLPRKQPFSPKEVANHLFSITDTVAWNKLLRRRFLEEYGFYFQAVHVIDDAFFSYTTLAVAKKIAVVPETLLFYRVNNPLSQISNRDRDPLTPTKVGALLKSWLEEQNLFSIYEVTFYQRILMLIHVYFDTMTLSENTQILYNQLRQESLSQLNLLHAAEKGMVPDRLKQWMEEVCRYSFQDYVGQKQHEESKQIPKGASCVLYGCGIRADLVYEVILRCEGVCHSVVDSSTERQGQVFRNLTIQAPQSLQPEDVDKVLVSTLVYFDAIKEKLLTLGFLPEQIMFV